MELKLNLDARKRVNITKLLPSVDIQSVRAYTKGDKIILEPLVEIPACELWLYKNKDALEAVKEGLEQSKKGKLRKRKSFAKYANDDV